MGLPSKAASALNICLKEKNEIVFNYTKNYSIFKSFFFPILRKTWYLSYLLHQMSLLNLKSHPTKIILSLSTEI